MGHASAQVDVAGLIRVAAGVTESADGFARAFSAQAAVLAPGSTLAGWATASVLPGATEAWSAFVVSLAGQVRSFGAGLSASARDYQAADTAAADRVRRAGAVPVAVPSPQGGHGWLPR